MRNFGNFMHKQQVETVNLLVKLYKEANHMKPSVEYIEDMVAYVSMVKNMSYKDLMEYAKQCGVKIPCPANY